MSLDIYLSELGPCEHCDNGSMMQDVYVNNITHNLADMAREAGIYEWVWCPEEVGITKASQLIEPLREGIGTLKANPDHFKSFNSPNGWGVYDNFIPWLEHYLAACEQFPNADVHASR